MASAKSIETPLQLKRVECHGLAPGDYLLYVLIDVDRYLAALPRGSATAGSIPPTLHSAFPDPTIHQQSISGPGDRGEAGR